MIAPQPSELRYRVGGGGYSATMGTCAEFAGATLLAVLFARSTGKSVTIDDAVTHERWEIHATREPQAGEVES